VLHSGICDSKVQANGPWTQGVQPRWSPLQAHFHILYCREQRTSLPSYLRDCWNVVLSHSFYSPSETEQKEINFRDNPIQTDLKHYISERPHLWHMPIRFASYLGLANVKFHFQYMAAGCVYTSEFESFVIE